MNSISKASAYLSKLFSLNYIVLFLVILFFNSCTTLAIEPSPKLHPAITHTTIEQTNLVYHITTIQLDHPAVSINATEPAVSKQFSTMGETTKNFALRTNAYVAINASPFSYPFSRLSKKRLIEGLYIHKKTVVSGANKNYSVLYFTENKRAFIETSSENILINEAYFAFGGFFTILDNNDVLAYKDIKDARTAVGISEDGFTLYIVTVEKNNKSKGLNYMECAKILQNLGATKAMQLDGGGSVALIFPNAPHQSVYSNRKVANNIGFVISE